MGGNNHIKNQNDEHNQAGLLGPFYPHEMDLQLKQRRSALQLVHSLPQRAFIGYLMLALTSQAVQGLYPGLLSYLQKDSKLQPLMIIGVSGVSNTLLLGIPFTIKFGWRKMIHINKPHFFVVIVLGGLICMLLATKYTKSVYVQLVMLSGPFWVVLMAKLFLDDEFPPHTLLAMCLTFVGAVIALFGDMFIRDEFSLSFDDFKGIGFAFVPAILLGGFFVFMQAQEASVQSEVLVWVSFVFQTLVIPISIYLEDWGTWKKLGVIDYTFFFGYSFGIIVVAQLLQILTIRKISASLVGVLLPVRMVAALIFGATPLLNEDIGPMNVVGSLVVISTVFVFLVYQYLVKKDNERFQTFAEET